MPRHKLILLIVIAMVLAACQGQSPTIPATTAPTVVFQPTATKAAVTPTVTEVVEQTAAEAPPGCTVISLPATPGPTEQSVFPPASDKDWSTGPKDAAITLIEYSDFQ